MEFITSREYVVVTVNLSKLEINSLKSTKKITNNSRRKLRNYCKRREDVRNVDLSVKETKAYRHNLDELPSGMSGELILVGEEGIILKKSETLGINLE
jgi:hypothetical protein